MTPDVAALFVDVRRGPYAAMPGVDCWGEERDARLYPGPWPVVAHPPCQRWGNFWRGGLRAGKPAKGEGVVPVYELGADGGCFASALESVRRWGGVLEHPAGSRAWRAFRLMLPGSAGWTVADQLGWTCEVEQGHYGHPCKKRTWLYAVGCDLPSLPWGESGATGRVSSANGSRDAYASLADSGVKEVGKTRRHITPPAFAELLVSMARSRR